ncbi:MAG: hypothetical protein Q7S00_04050, partial [bacterium]|nr:hypothetical protein [bacterium]
MGIERCDPLFATCVNDDGMEQLETVPTGGTTPSREVQPMEDVFVLNGTGPVSESLSSAAMATAELLLSRGIPPPGSRFAVLGEAERRVLAEHWQTLKRMEEAHLSFNTTTWLGRQSESVLTILKEMGDFFRDHPGQTFQVLVVGAGLAKTSDRSRDPRQSSFVLELLAAATAHGYRDFEITVVDPSEQVHWFFENLQTAPAWDFIFTSSRPIYYTGNDYLERA